MCNMLKPIGVREEFLGRPPPPTRGCGGSPKEPRFASVQWDVEVICSVTNITLSANEVMVLSRFVYLSANGMWVDFDWGVKR